MWTINFVEFEVVGLWSLPLQEVSKKNKKVRQQPTFEDYHQCFVLHQKIPFHQLTWIENMGYGVVPFGGILIQTKKCDNFFVKKKERLNK